MAQKNLKFWVLTRWSFDCDKFKQNPTTHLEDTTSRMGEQTEIVKVLNQNSFRVQFFYFAI